MHSGRRRTRQDVLRREGRRLVAPACGDWSRRLRAWAQPRKQVMKQMICWLMAAMLQAGAAVAAPTMRVDYYHTGNEREERFSLDRIVVEPLPWPGNPARPIDPTNRGKYFYEVADAKSGAVLYSRGFSSIYGEWETTAEAKLMNRTFSESLRFPAPDAPVKIVLKKRDAKNVFRDIWTLTIDPSDKFVERGTGARDSFDRGALITLHESGEPAQKLDLLIPGGGGIFGLYSTVAADSAWAPYIFVHEFGHHIAGLADEYYTSDVAYLPAADRVEPWEPNATALLDPSALKWKDLVEPGTPIPTPWPKEAFERYTKEIQQRRREIRAANRPEREMDELFREEQKHDTALLNSGPYASKVGAFEGANYEARGFYRPQTDCIMFTRDEVPFCAVCRRAIAEILDLYSR